MDYANPYFFVHNIIVTWFWKTDQIVIFGVLRNTNFKYWNHCDFLVLDCSHINMITLKKQTIQLSLCELVRISVAISWANKMQ